MKSEKRIKEMFEEINAPDELREKVISLGKKKKPSKWNKGMHRAAGMAVMLAADITEDFADGKAVGTIHLNIGDKTPEEDTGGKTFYTITGDMDDYDIALEGDDEAASQVQSTEE